MKNCSGGIRSFGALILALSILSGAILIFTGCGELDSYRGSEIVGTILLTMGFGSIIGGGITYNLFNGFAQLLDDVRDMKDHYAGGASKDAPAEDTPKNA